MLILKHTLFSSSSYDKTAIKQILSTQALYDSNIFVLSCLCWMLQCGKKHWCLKASCSFCGWVSGHH